jgi:hypothetical protein
MADDKTYLAEMFLSRFSPDYFRVITQLTEVNFLDGTTCLKNLQMEIPTNQIVGKLDLDRDAWTGVVFLKGEEWNFLPDKYCTTD